MSWRLKLGTKLEIENMCVMFWCLTLGRRHQFGALQSPAGYIPIDPPIVCCIS
jgi:hypothetical protein